MSDLSEWISVNIVRSLCARLNVPPEELEAEVMRHVTAAEIAADASAWDDLREEITRHLVEALEAADSDISWMRHRSKDYWDLNRIDATIGMIRNALQAAAGNKGEVSNPAYEPDHVVRQGRPLASPDNEQVERAVRAVETWSLRKRPPVGAVDIKTCEMLMPQIAMLDERPENRAAMLHYLLHTHGIVQLKGSGE